MQDEELIQKLDALEKKINTLVVKCNSLQKQLDTAVEENLNLKKIIKKQNQELNNFQNKENFNKLVTSIVVGTESATEIKKKLNKYIEDIDKCINYLSK